LNIFVLSRNVNLCAQSHCDQHVVKMPLETAQLLSTALHETDAAAWNTLNKQGLAYRPTHLNHPCALWTRQCINNYLWLCALGLALSREYTYRFGGSASPDGDVPAADGASGTAHKCEAVIDALRRAAPPLARLRCVTPFALAVPDDCMLGDPVASYRRYYVEHKSAFARWTRREPPEWYAEGVQRAGRQG
jgi:hypothetical protein